MKENRKKGKWNQLVVAIGRQWRRLTGGTATAASRAGEAMGSLHTQDSDEEGLIDLPGHEVSVARGISGDAVRANRGLRGDSLETSDEIPDAPWSLPSESADSPRTWREFKEMEG